MGSPLVPNMSHHLNIGKILWWMITPNTYGMGKVFDLMNNNHGNLIQGAGNTGIQFASPTQQRAYGRLVSDGNGYVSTNKGGTLPNKFTISFWFNVNFNAQFRGLFDWAIDKDDSNTQIVFHSRSTTALGWVLFNTASNTFTNTAGWHHTAIVYNGTVHTTYYDGIQQSTMSATFTTETNGTTILFGSGYNTPIVGSYDNLQIWNRPLSPAEVVKDYGLYKAGFPGVLYRPNKSIYATTRSTSKVYFFMD